MRSRTLTWAGLATVLAVLALVLISAAALAKKPPPPDPEPPADPAIAYTVTDRGKTKLMVMNADGSNQTVVLDIGEASASKLDWSPPGWSPPTGWPQSDLPYLAFKSDIQGYGVYVVRLDGNDLRKVVAVDSSTTWGGACWSPEALPDGDYRIAYVDKPTEYSSTELFLVDLDGSEPVQLTFTADAYETYPTWSPSASKLAVRLDHSSWGYYDFGSNTFVLQYHDGPLAGAMVLSPEWSKTAEDKIAWLSNGQDGDALNVWIVDLDDPSEPLRVTNTSAIEERAVSWSPDDSKLVVACADVVGGKWLKNHRFVVMDATAGSNAVKIADAASYPAWRR